MCLWQGYITIIQLHSYPRSQFKWSVLSVSGCTLHNAWLKETSTGKVVFAIEVELLFKMSHWVLHALAMLFSTLTRTRIDSCIIMKQLFLKNFLAYMMLHELSGIMCGCQTVTSVWYIPWVIRPYLDAICHNLLVTRTVWHSMVLICPDKWLFTMFTLAFMCSAFSIQYSCGQ